MTFGSLFSGIGGMDLGLERAGMECRWQVEIDEFCRKVLAKHWPNVKRYGDIREVFAGELECVDLICGGFPCEPFSVAGNLLRESDERWMWPDFYRIIRVLRPRFVLVENVPGLLSGGIGTVLGDLAASGYDAEWETLPASAFGAPHLRYRVFIVAYADRSWELQPQGSLKELRRRASDGTAKTVADVDGARLPIWQERIVLGKLPAIERSHWWSSEPKVERVVHGSPGRVDRIAALGRSVVPQVAEWIGRRILEAA